MFGGLLILRSVSLRFYSRENNTGNKPVDRMKRMKIKNPKLHRHNTPVLDPYSARDERTRTTRRRRKARIIALRWTG